MKEVLLALFLLGLVHLGSAVDCLCNQHYWTFRCHTHGGDIGRCESPHCIIAQSKIRNTTMTTYKCGPARIDKVQCFAYTTNFGSQERVCYCNKDWCNTEKFIESYFANMTEEVAHAWLEGNAQGDTNHGNPKRPKKQNSHGSSEEDDDDEEWEKTGLKGNGPKQGRPIPAHPIQQNVTKSAPGGPENGATTIHGVVLPTITTHPNVPKNGTNNDTVGIPGSGSGSLATHTVSITTTTAKNAVLGASSATTPRPSTSAYASTFLNAISPTSTYWTEHAVLGRSSGTTPRPSTFYASTFLNAISPTSTSWAVTGGRSTPMPHISAIPPYNGQWTTDNFNDPHTSKGYPTPTNTVHYASTGAPPNYPVVHPENPNSKREAPFELSPYFPESENSKDFFKLMRIEVRLGQERHLLLWVLALVIICLIVLLILASFNGFLLFRMYPLLLLLRSQTPVEKISPPIAPETKHEEPLFTRTVTSPPPPYQKPHSFPEKC